MSLGKEYEWIYEYVLETIKSPEFRNPIREFIDENCSSFIGVEENTFEQGGLFQEFVLLIENYLESALKNLGITDEMFCLAAKKGLEQPNDKKYFEQLISFTNYNYFKNLMTKRNLQLEKMAYEKMINNQQQQNNKNDLNMIKQLEERELKAAMDMSLALEEEKRKLKAIEELELKKAISKSKTIQNNVALAFKNNAPVKEEESSGFNLLKKSEDSIKINKSNVINSNSNDEKNNEQNKQIHQLPIQVERPNFSQIKMNDNNNNNNENNDNIDNNDNNNDDDNNNTNKIIANIERTHISPVQKVMMNQHEIDEDNKKNVIESKLVLPSFNPNFTGKKNNEALNNNLNNLEAEKIRKLREYREMVLRQRKEKRQKEEEDDLFNNNNVMTEDEKRKLALRKQLASKLKNNNLRKLNNI